MAGWPWVLLRRATVPFRAERDRVHERGGARQYRAPGAPHDTHGCPGAPWWRSALLPSLQPERIRYSNILPHFGFSGEKDRSKIPGDTRTLSDSCTCTLQGQEAFAQRLQCPPFYPQYACGKFWNRKLHDDSRRRCDRRRGGGAPTPSHARRRAVPGLLRRPRGGRALQALPVRALPGRLSGLSVLHSKRSFYGDCVWVRRVLNIQFRRLSARAGATGR